MFEINKLLEEPVVSTENGFVSLAVEESRIINVDMQYSSDGIPLKLYKKYFLNYRGSCFWWWKWGSIEVSLLYSLSLS